MKAIVLEKAGGVENLMLKDVEKAVPKENEILVKVEAISVNPVDFKVRGNEDGLTRFCGEKRPVILGWDISGVVEEVGTQVSLFEKGDKVFGMVNFVGIGNAYAEYVAAPESHMAKMPSNVSFEEAAATTLAALTAFQAMKGRVKNGDKVLIHAGSGGVGHFAIQIAKELGATVISTSSSKNKDFVMSLGADEHIDYRSQAFEEVLSDVDFVLDGLGGKVMTNSIKVLKDGGTIVSLLGANLTDADKVEAEKKKAHVIPIMVASNGDDMNTLKGMLEKGAIKPHVSKTFAFEDMGKAHLELESGRTVGKIIVKV